jgi:hypothetical protein
MSMFVLPSPCAYCWALQSIPAHGGPRPRLGSLLHQRREGAFKQKYEREEINRAINDYGLAFLAETFKMPPHQTQWAHAIDFQKMKQLYII